MEIPKNELFSVLQEYNPWWLGQPISDLPNWERSASVTVRDWIHDDKTKRALLLTGARQVGKTTLFRQSIRNMLKEGFPKQNIFFATFDHPLLKLAGLQRTIEAWNELYPAETGSSRFLFLDEIQYATDWQTWLKLQVDFQPTRRIAVTGSANPLHAGSVESGVGRWVTIPLPTLSFGEYLRLRSIPNPNLPPVKSLRELFDWQTPSLPKYEPAGMS